MTYKELLSLALAEEDALDKAVQKQFGPRATRWDHEIKEYNDETLAALDRKVVATERLLAFVRTGK